MIPSKNSRLSSAALAAATSSYFTIFLLSSFALSNAAIPNFSRNSSVAFVITRTASAATSLTSLSILMTRLTEPLGIIKSPSAFAAVFFGAFFLSHSGCWTWNICHHRRYCCRGDSCRHGWRDCSFYFRNGKGIRGRSFRHDDGWWCGNNGVHLI